MKKLILTLALVFSTQAWAKNVDLSGQWAGKGTVIQNNEITNCPNVEYLFSQTKISLYFATAYTCDDQITFEMEGELEIRGNLLVIEDTVVGELQADRAIIDHVQDGQKLYFEAVRSKNRSRDILDIKASMTDGNMMLGLTGEVDLQPEE